MKELAVFIGENMKLSQINEYAATNPSQVPKDKKSSYQRSGLATALPKYAPESEPEEIGYGFATINRQFRPANSFNLEIGTRVEIVGPVGEGSNILIRITDGQYAGEELVVGANELDRE